jgi:hypothetical protein
MPLFAFCIARGFFYTKNKGKYFTLMIIFAAISQMPFHFMRLLGRGVDLSFGDLPYRTMEAFRLDTHYNILVTWLLALLFLWGLERLLSEKFEWLLFTGALLIGPIAASFYLSFDFGLYGVILPGIFYLTFYGRSVSQGTSKKEVTFRAFDYINAFIFVAIATFLLWNPGSIQYYAVMAVPLIPLFINFDRKLKLPKLFFYLSYPIHIIVLVVIALVIH